MTTPGSGAGAAQSPPAAVDGLQRVTNWTLESAGSSRRRLSPRKPFSLSTEDIAGANAGTSPIFRAARYINKPCSFYNNDIAGSSPRRAIPATVNRRNDFNISNADIEHSWPESKQFHTRRVLDPLNPVYSLSSYSEPPYSPPPQRAQTCKIADIPGTSATALHRRAQRNHIDYSDVPFSQAGAMTRARKRQTEGLSLTARDINYPSGSVARFATKRCTNPLSPTYVIHAPPGVDREAFAESITQIPGSRPRRLRPQRPAEVCSLSLRSADIEGASARHPVPFPQQRRHWRATCHISDIDAAHPAGKFHKMHGSGSRCTDPCNPRYQSLERRTVHLPPPPPDTPAEALPTL